MLNCYPFAVANLVGSVSQGHGNVILARMYTFTSTIAKITQTIFTFV